MSDLLSTKQAAERIGKSPEAIRWHVKEGNLTPTVKMPGESGAYLFHPADVDALRQRLQARQKYRPRHARPEALADGKGAA
ncbi:MerR family transcriptional regulator [Nesterenkonia sp. K-15-9-6]|uniref:MerR family transcriptional regulator n=1 Tax=Nesterenkonia sp. K-15-9-6 TaxID=3093918 RepID=UPI00404449F9